VYLSVPVGFEEQWAGPSRLPDSSVRVSRLFRETYGAPALPLSPGGFRTAHTVVLLAVWGVYALLMRTFSRGGGGRKALVIAATAIIMLAPPVLSTDVYYYGATGWSAYRFGGNPHVQPPESIPSSQLLPYVYWTDFPSPYGPVWTALSTAVAGATGDDPFRSAMGFKAAATGSMLLSAWLVYLVARRLAPEQAARAAALFALNPLVLLESAGNAHNDALVALLLAATAWALCRGASALGLAGVVVAALVKLTVLPVLPLYVASRLSVGSMSERLRRLALIGAACITLAALTYAPYWEGIATLRPLAGQPLGGVQGLAPVLVYRAVWAVSNEPTGELAARVFTVAAVAALGAWMLATAYSYYRRPGEVSARREIADWGALLVLLPILFIRSYPWYVVPGLALLAAVYPYRARWTHAAYALTALWFIVRNGF